MKKLENESKHYEKNDRRNKKIINYRNNQSQNQSKTKVTMLKDFLLLFIVDWLVFHVKWKVKLNVATWQLQSSTTAIFVEVTACSFCKFTN